MRFSINLLGLIFLVLAVILAIGYFTFDRAMIAIVSKVYRVDIAYSQLLGNYSTGYLFTDLNVSDKKRGVGISSKYAKIKPRLGIKGLLIDMGLKNVRFTRNFKDTPETYSDLPSLVATPFNGRWLYNDITGLIEISGSGIRLKTFNAASSQIRLSLSGELGSDNNLDLNATIFFNAGITKEVPEILANVVLQPESGGWKSLSARIKGNYTKPAIEVSSKLFKLTIKETSQK